MTTLSDASLLARGKRSQEQLVERLKLHMLTDRELSRGRDTLTVARAAIDGGVTIIQLRDKRASTKMLVEQGLALRVLTRERGVLLIVNDRIDVALAVDADGVHIGQDDDMPVGLARQLLGPQRILGISAGNLQEAAAAMQADPDYLSVGPIYTTRAKPDAGPSIGTQLISELARRYTIPLIGIGGIGAGNAAEVIQAGAIGVAVITAIVGAEDITRATLAIVQALQHGKDD
jgi:thiamine-phosphate pyrophosphorylase